MRGGVSFFVYLIILRWFISFSCWSGRELSQFLFGSGVPPDQENDDGGEQDPGDTATEDEAQHDVSVIWHPQTDRVLSKRQTDTVKIMINTVRMTFHMINMLPFFVRAHCSENTVKFGYTESLYHDLPPYNLLSIHNALEIQWNLNVQNSCYQVKEYQDKCCHIRDPQSNNAVICPHCSEPQNEMWI